MGRVNAEIKIETDKETPGLNMDATGGSQGPRSRRLAKGGSKPGSFSSNDEESPLIEDIIIKPKDEDSSGNMDMFEISSLNKKNRYPSPLFPFPVEIDRNILDRLSPSDLQKFAMSSKSSHITALTLLAQHVILPLPSHKTFLERVLGVNTHKFVETATVDISNPLFYATNYPGGINVGKKLREFRSLKHLIIEKSAAYASDAVLGSVLLFLVEQDTLQELTFNFNIQDHKIEFTGFSKKFQECWKTVHSGAFHRKQRKLITLNITVKNKDAVYDGLKDVPELWLTLLPTVRKLRLNLKDFPSPSSTAQAIDGRWCDLLQMTSSSGIVDLEAIFDHSVTRPYTNIGFYFPKLERLKVSFKGPAKERNHTELAGLGRMAFLRSVDLPWAYNSILSNDVGVIGKAKEKAKEVVQAKSVVKSKEDKLKMQLLKHTKNTLTLQRLTSIKDVTWRYAVEDNEDEVSTKFLIQWAGTEPHITEVNVSGY